MVALLRQEIPVRSPCKKCGGPRNLLRRSAGKVYWGCQACLNAAKARWRVKAYVPRPDGRIGLPEARRLRSEGKKRCPACADVLPATLEFYYSNRAAWDRLTAYCQPCVRKKRRGLGVRRPLMRIFAAFVGAVATEWQRACERDQRGLNYDLECLWWTHRYSGWGHE